MTKEMLDVYQSIVDKTDQIKALEADVKALKAKVSAYHDGKRLVCEDGFESTLKHTVRDTPQPKAIAEAFGISNFDHEHFPDCFKRVEYDSVTVKKLIVEG